MQFRTKSIVHQVIRPVWNAWMRFGNHQLSLTALSNEPRIAHEAECPSHQFGGAAGSEHATMPGENGI